MSTIAIRGVEIGAGVPKIIVPIVGKTAKEILDKAAEIVTLPVDMVEWRADFYGDVTETDTLLDTAAKLRAALGDLPILFTIRTKHDGGELDVGFAEYVALNNAVAGSGSVDLIDVEIYREDDATRAHIADIQKAGVRVVGSYHDFGGTPARARIVEILRAAQDMGSDVPKIAVMPKSTEDVFTLLSASAEMKEKYAEKPLLTISMGPLGMVSRIACEISGSSMTFGAAGQTSAPGQMQAKELRQCLETLHTAAN